MKPQALACACTGWKARATGILAHYRGQARGMARKGSIADAISGKEVRRGARNDIFFKEKDFNLANKSRGQPYERHQRRNPKNAFFSDKNIV
jgi:hypothetical protein